MSLAPVPKPASAGVARTAIVTMAYAYVNLRSGPGTNYTDIGDIRDKTLLVYYPNTKQGAEGWVWIEQRNTQGWIAGNLVKFEDVVADPNKKVVPTPYDGQAGLWLWKGQGLAERTIEDFAKNIKKLAPNVKQIWVKTNEGPEWQGRWDNSQLAINGPESIDKWVSVLQSHGLEFHAWCVLRGLNINGEANTIIQACLRPGVKSMILDVEPYEGYWSGGKAAIRPLMTRIRQSVPGAFHIGLGVDPRRAHYAKIDPLEWFPFVNSVHPMVYWRTFRRTPEDVLKETYEVWGGYGRPIIPILQGDAEVIDQEEAITLATKRFGAPGISWWRYGVIAQWKAVNTSVSLTPVNTGSTPQVTDQYSDEKIIVPGGPGFRSGSYTGKEEFQKYMGTWGWEVYYKNTEAQGSKVWAEWKTDLPASGTYQISTFIPARHATTRKARFKIHGIKGTNTEVVVDLDQSRTRNEWVSLGIFELEKGAPNAGRVFLNDLTGEVGEEIAFDAIRWRRIVQTTTPATPSATTPGVPRPSIVNGVYVADGYDSPVGTQEERRGTVVWPKNQKGWTDASPFGRLYFVGTPREAYHTGADLNWGTPYEDKGQPVYSCANGVVVFAARIAVWGNVIVIRHDPLYTPTGPVIYSRYGHIQNMKVQVSQRVKRGELIAEIGDAFGTLVPHLHFDLSPTTVLEIRPSDWPGKNQALLLKNYIDPLLFIRANRP